MSKAIIWIIVVLVVLGGIFYYLRMPLSTPAPTGYTEESTPPPPPEPSIFPNSNKNESPQLEKKPDEVHITNAGFSPSTITIRQGEWVTWINDGDAAAWPASALHPTHTVYPGSSVEKCGTPDQSKIFDACRGLKKGEEWTFVFNEVGEWRYHDHLDPSHFGKIIVQ